MSAGASTDERARQVSAGVRFGLAALCCGVFIVTVTILALITGAEPLGALRKVSVTFWAVCVNFLICLGTVAYVSQRLQRGESKRTDAR
jgi:membrane protein implicated in regulation of membrane protease activity